MRSNIARTCPSSRVPLRAPELTAGALLAAGSVALELRQERDEVALLLRVEVPVGGHRRRRVLQRPLDRAGQQLLPDVRQLGARPVVAVLGDLVAGEAA